MGMVGVMWCDLTTYWNIVTLSLMATFVSVSTGRLEYFFRIFVFWIFCNKAGYITVHSMFSKFHVWLLQNCWNEWLKSILRMLGGILCYFHFNTYTTYWINVMINDNIFWLPDWIIFLKILSLCTVKWTCLTKLFILVA